MLLNSVKRLISETNNIKVVVAFLPLKYAELETILGDTDRARALFELAVNQPLLDMPEVNNRGSQLF